MIYIYDGMTMLDAIGPYEILRNIKGATIKFVSKQKGECAIFDSLLPLSGCNFLIYLTANGQRMSRACRLGRMEIYALFSTVLKNLLKHESHKYFYAKLRK